MNLGNCNNNNNNNKCNIIFVILLFSCGIANAFYVEGNRLYNSSNNMPILLRGIARPSLEWAANGEGLSLNDYTLMRSWGSNAVRLSLSQCFWLSTSSQYVSSYINTVDQQVTWIKSLGMAVILDLHWSDQNGAVQCAQQKMADSNSIPFWTQVATRYRNDSMILFELYNEPHDVSWNLWLNGGASGDGWNVVGMQQLYNTVRATGASNVVIVSGLNWAYDLSGLPAYQLTGYNIMYNTHPYNFAGKQTADWPSGFGFLASSYALIATEFGEFSCDATFNQHFVDYANLNAISWTGWGWYPGGCGFPALITSWDGTPSVPGAVIKYDLLNTPKVPGVLPNRTTTTTGSSGGNSVDVVVYADSLQSGFQDWSWAITKNPAATAYVHSGSYSYSFTTNLYEAVYFYKSGGISTTQFMGLEFWVNGGTSGNQNIKFNLVRYTSPTSTAFGPDNSVASYTSSGAIQANTWTRAFVDFSLFPAGSYDGFWFQDIGSVHGSTLYFDDIVLKAFPSTTSTSTTSSKSATTTTTSTSTSSKATTTSTTAAATTTKVATTSTTGATVGATTAATVGSTTTTTAKSSTTAATTAATVGSTTTTAKSSTTAATVGTTTTAKSSTTAATVGTTSTTAQGSTSAATVSSTTAAGTTKVATTAATSKASTSSVSSSTSSFSSPNNSSSTTTDPTEDDGTALLSNGEKINANNNYLLIFFFVSFVYIYL